jgi:Glycosyltransferase family 87
MRGATATAPAPVRRAAPALPFPRAVGAAGLLVLAATGVALAAASASAPSRLVIPSRVGFPDWMAGPLRLLDAPALTLHGLSVGLALMAGAYLVVLLAARAGGVSLRGAIVAVVGLHLVFLLAPPTTTDLFGYMGYARLPALHGLNPYTHGADSLLGDPVHQWLIWHRDPSPYGPLFTLASYAAVPLGVSGGMWALKVVGAMCSLAIVALVARAARAVGRDPVAAILLVGLNPLLLIYTVAGAHNDLEMMVAVMAALVLVLERRDAAAGALAAAAVALKASAVIPLFFMIPLARRRRPLVAGAVIGAAAIVVAVLVVIGPGIVHAPAAIAAQQDKVSPRSPLAVAAGWVGGASDGTLHSISTVLLLGAFAVLVVRAWRGAEPITSAAWATVALLLATTWLMAWYVVWILPLAALTRTRGPRVAALGICGFIIATRTHLLV